MGPANHPCRGIDDGRVGSDHLRPAATHARSRSIQPSRSCCGGSSRSAWVRIPLFGSAPRLAVGRKSAIECCAAREWTTPPRKTSAAPISRSSTRASPGWQARYPLEPAKRSPVGTAVPPHLRRRQAPALTPSRSRSASRLFRCWRFLPLRSRIFPIPRFRPRPKPLPGARAQSC